MAASPSGGVRFGLFTLNVHTGELLRNGVKVRLPEQPFQILALLLERPGEVVTREELRKKLWGESTFVDFDHSLNWAIRRLRECLGDTAQQPRFIETLPRRGYRFIAPVSLADQAQMLEEKPEERAGSRKLILLLALLVAFVVTLAGVRLTQSLRGWRDQLLARTLAKRIRSVVILPLENLSKDTEQEYFAEGMTDQLTTNLAKLGGLRVISRTSAMRYKGTRKPLAEIARELHVDAVVEGSVLRSGDRVRISAQLVDAATDQHLWAESYERDLRDVLALQSDVARGIADQIRIKLLPGQPARPVNPEAYEAYLRGRYELNAATSEADIDRSISSFELAMTKDPQSALGYAGLAVSFVALSDYYRPPREVMPKAKEAARKALELDEKLSEAHDALGWVEFIYGWNWSRAEQHLKRAIELNAGNALAHDHYANYLSSFARHTEAIAESQRAQEIDPLSLVIQADSGLYFYMSREYDRAIEQEHRAVDLAPNCYTCRTYLALAYAQKTQFAEALSEARRVRLPEASPIDVAATGSVIASAGERAEAEKLLRDLRQVARRRFVCPYEIATTYLALGERNEALRWLEKAYAARSVCMIWLGVDPRLDPLRSDPRFQDLLRRIGLPP